ncbi:MAG: TonB-dependent receptor [Chlorobi bacterium]|nr:TonB-dependent receptor [Chlorobiota bacterium]
MKKNSFYDRNTHGLFSQKAYRIMKLTLVMMLVGILNVYSGNLYSQSENVTVSLKNTSVKQVLKELESLTPFTFLYNDELVDINRKISINVKDKALKDVLDDIFSNSEVTYKIIENRIILIPTKDKILSSVNPQESITITGTVTDKFGDPIPGVSVYIKGTTKGTITGVDGKYSLVVSGPDDVIVFSFIGFTQQEITVGNRRTIDVTLVEEITDLGEVVVTGYGTVTKEAYTGSASVVSAKKIEERPVASFQDVLRGNSPGTLVTGTGQPGVMNTVRLRGISSMNASNSPLYVIDGVIIDISNISGSSQYAINPLNTINPSDIKSITVLKDAASASLYGSRGANGVIVITTKHGLKTDKPKYSVDFQAGVSNIFYASKPDLVNAEEFTELWLEGEMHYQIRRKTGYDEFFEEVKKLYADKDNYYVSGRNYHEWYEYAQYQFNKHFRIWNPYEDDWYDYDFFGEDADKLPDVNWYDEVTRSASFQKFNVSTQGGSGAMNYYASLEYFNQEGILLGSDLQRYSLRMNLNSKPEGALVHWGLNNYVSYNDQNGPRANAYGYEMPQYTALAIAPVAPVYLDDGSFNTHLPKNVNGNHNPVADAKVNEHKRPQTKVLTSGWIQINFTKWLNLNNRASLDYTYARRREWYNKDFGSGIKYKGYLYERDARRRKIMNTTLLNFNQTFKGKHNVNGYAGIEIEDMKYEYTTATGTNFPTNKTPYLSVAATPYAIGGAGSTYGMFSFLSAVNYSLSSKYYLSATFRSDQSSRFADDYRTGNFWSVSGAWRISEEEFMQSLTFLDNLKIKASYGTNGTLPSEYYAWQSLYSFGADYMLEPGGVPASIANVKLTWEENNIFNVGFDARLFNRVNLGFEFYNRTTENLLQDVPISGTAGFTTMLVNSEASLQNKGIELDVSTDIIRTENFLWNMNLNFAWLHNEFSGLDHDIMSSTQIQRNGESYYTWFMPEWAGIDHETGEQQWYYTDENGNNAITKNYAEAERRILGKALPDFNGGVSTTFSWKGLELNMLFTYALGFKVIDYTGRVATKNDGYRDYRGIERDQLDRWTPDNPEGKNPIRVNSKGTWDRYRSSRYLYDGDYIKLKNIKLQYSIPQSLVNKLKISSISVFAQAENLWVATDLKGYDPEISLSGFRSPDQYPTATTYTGGIKVNF